MAREERAKKPPKEERRKEEKKRSKSVERPRRTKDKEPDDDRARRREERARRREEKLHALKAAAAEPGAAVQFIDNGAAAEAAAPRPPPSAPPTTAGGFTDAGRPPLLEIDEYAYSRELAALHGALNGPIALKRRELANVAQRVEANIERVQAARGAIERETRANADGILQRLRVHERSKLAVLQTELARALAQLRDIDEFSGEVLSSAMASTPVEKRAVAPRLQALADQGARLAAMAVDPPSLIDHDDLPQETRERQRLLSRHEALEGVLRVKDAMCWTLLRERQGNAERASPSPSPRTADLDARAADEIGRRAVADAERAAVEAEVAAAEERVREEVAEEYEAEMAEWSTLAEEQGRQLQASHQEVQRLRSENERLRALLGATASGPPACGSSGALAAGASPPAPHTRASFPAPAQPAEPPSGGSTWMPTPTSGAAFTAQHAADEAAAAALGAYAQPAQGVSAAPGPAQLEHGRARPADAACTHFVPTTSTMAADFGAGSPLGPCETYAAAAAPYPAAATYHPTPSTTPMAAVAQAASLPAASIPLHLASLGSQLPQLITTPADPAVVAAHY